MACPFMKAFGLSPGRISIFLDFLVSTSVQATRHTIPSPRSRALQLRGLVQGYWWIKSFGFPACRCLCEVSWVLVFYLVTSLTDWLSD
jgi:hypothetical protein